jgi:hypothetical protein
MLATMSCSDVTGLHFCLLASLSSQEARVIMSKLNRMDEKLGLLSRKVTMLSNRSAGGGVGSREVPSVPEGMTLPADSV